MENKYKDCVGEEYLKGASDESIHIVKGAYIIGRFLKGAYKLMWMDSNYMVGSGRHYSHMGFHRGSRVFRFHDVNAFLRKTVCTENARGEYRYRLEGFPVG